MTTALNHRWVLAPPLPEEAARLASRLEVSPLLSQCLLNRGLGDPDRAAAFLAPRLKHLTAPEDVPGLSRAVDRLIRAHDAGESVAIFGDYDVDGVTATALLLEVLGGLGWNARWYLPHRLEEGYGLSREAAENCVQQGRIGVLLAVDCGSTSAATVDWLQGTGVDVIVLDHHQISNPSPAAWALVNPQLNAAGYGSHRELCSAGLAFKLAHGLVKRGRELGWPAAEALDVRSGLDLVALGTIADLVPLQEENRLLVTAGLERLNRLERPGLRCLATVAGIRGEIGPYEVGFQLGPRLNAAGRLESAGEALELLLTRDPVRAQALAASLDAQNQERQQIERGIAEEVIRAVRARFDPERDYVIVEGELLWHVGVVGIVASRVLQEFHRPTLVFGGDGHEWRGSGRSIEGFDLASALRGCSDLLVRHGGHAMAAGLTIDPARIPAFRTRLNELARASLRPEQLRPAVRLDAVVELGDLTVERLKELERLAPMGQGNPPVHFCLQNLQLRGSPHRIGRNQQHLKFWVQGPAGAGEVLWWNAAERPWPSGVFDLACAPQLNEFGGRISVQLKALDWRPSAAGATAA